MMMRRGRKTGLVGLLLSCCLLLVLVGLLILSGDRFAADISASTQRSSVNSIMAQETVTGTVTVTPTVTITTSATITPSATITQGTTSTPQATVNSPINTPTETPTPTPTATATATPVPTETPTETPTPTPTPIVTVPPTDTPVSAPALLSFKSDTASIALGDSVEFSWEIIGASAITLTYDAVQEVMAIDRTTFTHSPLITTTYTLAASSGGGVVSKQLTVGVDPNAGGTFDSPLEPPFESPLEPPFESPLDIPTETATATPTETPTVLPSPTRSATPTSTPTLIPSNTFTATPRVRSTAQPIGLTLTPLAFDESIDGESALNGNDVASDVTQSERLRYVWYYALLSLCVLLPILILAVALLFWLVGSREERARRDLFEE